MKRGGLYYFLVLIVWSGPVWAQNSALHTFWKTSHSSHTLAIAEQKLLEIIAIADKKNAPDDLAYLFQLYRLSQKKIFKSYSPYVNVDELVIGRYDCLTATAWFAALLAAKHYEVEIVETNYHIFLIVHTSRGKVLLETTDRYNGFVTDKNEMAARIGEYKKSQLANPDKNNFLYSFHLYNQVQPYQLTGLLFFNQAVNAFNTGQLNVCVGKLMDANEHYPTPRNAELAALLLQKINWGSGYSREEKIELTNQLKGIAGVTHPAIASR